MSDELKRAYEMVQKDLQDKDVYQVSLYGDGSVELATTWEADGAAYGQTLFEAVQNLCDAR